MGDFNEDIISVVSHRPWPMPSSPWIMTQTWNDLLFAHWPVPAKQLRHRVPEPFELDLFEDMAWIGVVPFHMSNVSLRGVPALPWVSAFAELNVRTYVRVGGKPGVFLFSLDAERVLAVAGARTLLNLPYHTAEMSVHHRDGSIEYSSQRVSDRSVELAVTYTPYGDASASAPGELAYFLTERYCLYALDASGKPYRLEIHHPPWQLQLARAHITHNTMTTPIGVALSGAPLTHFSKRQDIVAWAPDSLA